MAGAKASKNNPDNKEKATKGKYALSDDCEKCTKRCPKGEVYLKRFAIKKEGNGVWCQK